MLLYKLWSLRHNDPSGLPLISIICLLSFFVFIFFPYFSFSDVLTTEWLKLWRNNRCSLVRWPLVDEKRLNVFVFLLVGWWVHYTQGSDSPLLLSASPRLRTTYSLYLSLSRLFVPRISDIDRGDSWINQHDRQGWLLRDFLVFGAVCFALLPPLHFLTIFVRLHLQGRWAGNLSINVYQNFLFFPSSFLGREKLTNRSDGTCSTVYAVDDLFMAASPWRATTATFSAVHEGAAPL